MKTDLERLKAEADAAYAAWAARNAAREADAAWEADAERAARKAYAAWVAERKAFERAARKAAEGE